MTRRLLATMAMLASLAWTSIANGDITAYNQNFEGLNKNSGTALSGDGWKVFANVFKPDGSYLYGYGPFGAPNGGAGFSAIADGSAGPAQGVQYLNVYSDYNNGDHANGNYIDALVFQEQTLGAANVGTGKGVSFGFDYLKNGFVGNGDGDTRTFAFIKVLKQSDFSYGLLGQAEFETTGASTTNWATQSLFLATSGAWAGELVQFGFRSYTTSYKDSGRFYDNVSFNAVPEPTSLGLVGAGLLGLVVTRRARRR